MKENEAYDFRGPLAVWWAVLDLAVKDARREGYCNYYQAQNYERIKQNAIAWFKSESKEMCSFLWICEVLDLNPDKVREGVLNPHQFTDDSAPLGTRIRNYRRHLKLSQAQLAEKVGCGKSTISKIEVNSHYGFSGVIRNRLQELINAH